MVWPALNTSHDTFKAGKYYINWELGEGGDAHLIR